MHDIGKSSARWQHMCSCLLCMLLRPDSEVSVPVIDARYRVVSASMHSTHAQCQDKRRSVAAQCACVTLCYFVCDVLLVLNADCGRYQLQDVHRQYSSSGCLGNCNWRCDELIQQVVGT